MIEERQKVLTQEMEELTEESDQLRKELRTHDARLHWEEKRKQWEKYLPTAVAVPAEYKAWSKGEISRNTYFVAYDDVEMSIRERPDDNFPNTFRINEEKLPELFLLKVCYESFPRTAGELKENSLVDNPTMLTKAKDLLSTNWQDKWSFGLTMFLDWIRHFYRVEKGIEIWQELESLAYAGTDQFIE